jgi:hypothetical protein
VTLKKLVTAVTLLTSMGAEGCESSTGQTGPGVPISVTPIVSGTASLKWAVVDWPGTKNDVSGPVGRFQRLGERPIKSGEKVTLTVTRQSSEGTVTCVLNEIRNTKTRKVKCSFAID